MKSFGITLALLVVVGAAAFFVLTGREVNPTGPAPNAGSDAPEVDLAALKTKAEAGDADAAYQLARAIVKGEQGLPNYKEAARWFQVAADQENADAMVSLAELYTVGQGVTNNPTEALRLYLAAARKGNTRAMYSLAGLYEEGRGVKKNQALAARWHQLAAERGVALAQFNLGQRYELGLGVKADLTEAWKWLTLASRQGIQDAAELLGRVEPRMTREQIAEARRRVDGFTVVTAPPTLPDGATQ